MPDDVGVVVAREINERAREIAIDDDELYSYIELFLHATGHADKIEQYREARQQNGTIELTEMMQTLPHCERFIKNAASMMIQNFAAGFALNNVLIYIGIDGCDVESDEPVELSEADLVSELEQRGLHPERFFRPWVTGECAMDTEDEEMFAEIFKDPYVEAVFPKFREAAVRVYGEMVELYARLKNSSDSSDQIPPEMTDHALRLIQRTEEQGLLFRIFDGIRRCVQTSPAETGAYLM